MDITKQTYLNALDLGLSHLQTKRQKQPNTKKFKILLEQQIHEFLSQTERYQQALIEASSSFSKLVLNDKKNHLKFSDLCTSLKGFKDYINQYFIRLKSNTSYIKLLKSNDNQKIMPQIQKKVKKQKRILRNAFRFELQFENLAKIQDQRALALSKTFECFSLVIEEISGRIFKQPKLLRKITKYQNYLSKLKTTMTSKNLKANLIRNEIIYKEILQKHKPSNYLDDLQTLYENSYKTQNCAADLKRAQEIAFLRIINQTKASPIQKEKPQEGPAEEKQLEQESSDNKKDLINQSLSIKVEQEQSPCNPQAQMANRDYTIQTNNNIYPVNMNQQQSMNQQMQLIPGFNYLPQQQFSYIPIPYPCIQPQMLPMQQLFLPVYFMPTLQHMQTIQLTNVINTVSQEYIMMMQNNPMNQNFDGLRKE